MFFILSFILESRESYREEISEEFKNYPQETEDDIMDAQRFREEKLK